MPLWNIIIIEIFMEEGRMKPRKLSVGSRNMIGQNVARLRKERGIAQKDFISRLQTMGVDINPTS